MGLAVFGDLEHRMNNVLGVMIPPQVHGEQVRQMMLNDFAIEIGTSFGPLQGKIWRIGTMGYNARKDCVLQTLAALEAVLNRLGFATQQGRPSRRPGTCTMQDGQNDAAGGAAGRRAGDGAL